MKQSAAFFSLMFLFSCSSQKKIEESTFYEENNSINLYAFIGKRVSVESFNPNINDKKKIKNPNSNDSIMVLDFIMDEAFLCRYQVCQNVFNKQNMDTIQFEAYDHDGIPEFKKFKYALLYLSKNKEGKFISMKYQYDAIKKTKRGFRGKNGKSIKKLFLMKKENYLKERILF